MSSRAEEAAGPVTEKFAASSGRYLGFVAIGMGLVLIGAAAADSLGDHWGLAAFGLALGLLSWAVMVRPAVVAHERGLVMHNVLRDVFVPWSSIERCRALQTLQVATPEGIVHGLGLSRSARSMMQQQVGGRTVLGSMFASRGYSTPKITGRAREEVQSSLSYAEFVESTILARAAEASGPPEPLQAAPTIAPIAALTAAALLVLASLLSFL